MVSPRSRSVACGLVVAAAVFALSPPAAAQERFQLRQLRPGVTGEDDFGVSRAMDLGHLRYSVRLSLDYAHNPLVYEFTHGTASSELGAIVADQVNGTLALSLGLFDRLVIHASLPVVLYMGNDPSSLGGFFPGERDAPGLGDLTFGARVLLAGSRNDAASLALSLVGTAPTSLTERHFSGEQSFTVTPALLFEARAGRFRVNIELGARVRPDTDFLGVTISDELTFGAGFAAELLQGDVALTGHAELFGASAFQALGDRERSPLMSLFGVKVRADGFGAGLAAGPGLTRGLGAPDVYVTLTLDYTAPSEEEDREPEPDPKPEVETGDRDGDGLLDDSDACPDEPEDPDGLRDNDGCPEDDADGDGVLDTADACPLTPGLAEPMIPECKGCPAGACVQSGKIVILQTLEFKTGKAVLLDESEATLQDVRSILQSSEQMKVVRIEGHTDNRSRKRFNLELSGRRALAVYAWLVDKGVDAARLEAWGCGENVPIVSNKSKIGREANRRVELHIVDPAPASGARNPYGCNRYWLDDGGAK